MNNPSMASSRSKRGSAASTRAAYQKPARRRGRATLGVPGGSNLGKDADCKKSHGSDYYWHSGKGQCCTRVLGGYLPPWCVNM